MLPMLSHRPSHPPFVAALLLLCLTASSKASADEIAEFLFWNEMGEAAGLAVQSYADYQQERQLWSERIAAAQIELERCGGCASAQAELEKWQSIERQFHDVAGGALVSVGAPPIIAAALGINIPLAPRRTPEEWAQMCEVVRRDWIDQRPDFCQEAAERHVNCLMSYQQAHGLCSWRQATAPGGQCWETKKLSDHCYSEDFDSFRREQDLQTARASGEVIPEYVQPSTTALVLYGTVPSDYVLEMPPTEAIRTKLAEEQTQELRFVMRRPGEGGLGEATVKEFMWQDVAPEREACFDPEAQLPELDRRVCDDLYEIRVRYSPILLVCYYNLPRQLAADSPGDAIYWLHQRPDGADPALLLRRTHQHPLLEVGDARTTCPATIEEARRIDSEYQSELASLRSEVVQVSESTEWQSAWILQERAANEARMEAEQTARLAAFPLEGSFESTISTDFAAGPLGIPKANRNQLSECQITRSGETSVQLSCKERDGRRQAYSATGSIQGSRLVIRWSPNLEIGYTVSDCFPLLCLAGRDDEGPYRRNTVAGTLVREGSFGTDAFAEAMSQFQLEGDYDLELSSGDATLTLRCTIERDVSYTPNRFPAECASPDGTSYASDGVPDRQEPFTVRWRFFSDRTPIMLGSSPVESLSFGITDVLRQNEPVLTLMGSDGRGVRARLVRAVPGSGQAQGTRLEDLPALNGGDYVSILRQNGVLTLEQLADLSDDQANDLGIGWIWRRDLAREYLAIQSSSDLGSNDEPEAHASLTAPAPGLTGRWVGSYTCETFPVPITLELVLDDRSDGSLWGIMNFSAAPERPIGAEGSFYVYGGYVSFWIDGQQVHGFELNPGAWIERPAGWSTVALKGSFEFVELGTHTGEMEGQISSCDEFQARRLEHDIGALGTMPEQIVQVLADHDYVPPTSLATNPAP